MQNKRPRALSRFVLLLICTGLLAGCGLDLLTRRDRDEPSGPVQVMFIGNSLTGWGDTLSQFEALAEAADIDVVVGNAARNSVRLTEHIESYETKAMIAERLWDYIVLQGSSYLIAFPDSIEVVAQPYEILQTIIRNNSWKTRIVLFMDWSMDPVPGGNYTFSEFSQMLHDGTLLLANRLKCMVAPIGWMWKRVREERPTLQLQKDTVHPNLAGGYLQACVYFATIFRKSPVGNDYTGRLDEEVAAYLQQTAADIVLKNRSKWRLPGS